MCCECMVGNLLKCRNVVLFSFFCGKMEFVAVGSLTNFFLLSYCRSHATSDSEHEVSNHSKRHKKNDKTKKVGI